MSAAENNPEQPKAEQTKNNATLKVVLDHSYQEQKLREELDKAHEQIGALLKSEHEKFDLENERKKVEADMYKPLPKYEAGSTARLDMEPSYQRDHPQVMPMEGSNISPNQVCSSSVQGLINNINKLSHTAENAAEYKAIENKLLKKMLHNPKTLDLKFVGSSVEFLRHSKPIPEFATEQEKQAIENYNNRLRDNRQKWQQGD